MIFREPLDGLGVGTNPRRRWEQAARTRGPASYDPSALNEAYEDQNDGRDEQDMNEPAHRE